MRRRFYVGMPLLRLQEEEEVLHVRMPGYFLAMLVLLTKRDYRVPYFYHNTVVEVHQDQGVMIVHFLVQMGILMGDAVV